MSEPFDEIVRRIRERFADSTGEARRRAELHINKLHELREKHAILLLVPKTEIPELQERAIRADIANGERFLFYPSSRRGLLKFYKYKFKQ